MWVLVILAMLFFIYRVAFEVPTEIKKLEDKIDILKLHLQEVELKLDQLDKKLDKV